MHGLIQLLKYHIQIKEICKLNNPTIAEFSVIQSHHRQTTPKVPQEKKAWGEVISAGGSMIMLIS